MMHSRVYTKFDCERINDLSVNFNAKDPVEEKNFNILLSQISRAKPVDQKKIKPNIVTINSRFVLRNLGNGEKNEYSLVFPREADVKRNRISILSDLGSQILGSSIGSVVKGNPDTNQYLAIEDILYQPEASGDYNL